MPEDVDFKKGKLDTKLRYEGVVDLEEMYQTLREWLDYRRFEFHERGHKNKPMPHGREHEITFYAERKESEYVMFIINIYIHAFYVEDVEIIKNGQKKKVQKVGSMYIDIWPTLRLDWQGRWESSSFKRKARTFFHKFIIPAYIGIELEDHLYYMMYKLHTKLKEFLDMESKYTAYAAEWETV